MIVVANNICIVIVNSDICVRDCGMEDPLRTLPGYALRRASAAMLSDLNSRLSHLGLRHTDVAILVLIEANPRVTQSALGRALDVDRANLVPLVARLEARELLDRSPVDGRSHGLSLSSTGEAFMKQIWPVIKEHEQALITRIPVADRRAFAAALVALW